MVAAFGFLGWDAGTHTHSDLPPESGARGGQGRSSHPGAAAPGRAKRSWSLAEDNASLSSSPGSSGLPGAAGSAAGLRAPGPRVPSPVRARPPRPSCTPSPSRAPRPPGAATFLPHSPALRQLGRPSLPEGAAASPQPIGILGPSRPSHELAPRAERRSNARPPPSFGGSEPRGRGGPGRGERAATRPGARSGPALSVSAVVALKRAFVV